MILSYRPSMSRTDTVRKISEPKGGSIPPIISDGSADGPFRFEGAEGEASRVSGRHARAIIMAIRSSESFAEKVDGSSEL